MKLRELERQAINDPDARAQLARELERSTQDRYWWGIYEVMISASRSEGSEELFGPSLD